MAATPSPAPTMRQAGLGPLLLVGVLTVGAVSGVLVALSVNGTPLVTDGGLSVADSELAETAIGRQPGSGDEAGAAPADDAGPTTTVAGAAATSSLLLSPSTLLSPEAELWSSPAPKVDPQDTALDAYGVFTAPNVDSRLASFVVVDDMIVTSAAAIDGRKAFWLRADGQWTAADLVMADPYTDVAVLRSAEPLPNLPPPSEIGEAPVAGAEVVARPAPLAAGYADDAGHVGFVVSPGEVITTSLNRLCYDAFATSLPASMTPPGSALLDADGHTVAMTIATEAATAAAVPMSVVAEVARSMTESGSPATAWLGIEATVDSAGRTLVIDVVPSGPAADVLMPQDVILSIDGRSVQNPDHLVHLVRAIETDVEAELTIERDGATELVDVRPAPVAARG